MLHTQVKAMRCVLMSGIVAAAVITLAVFLGLAIWAAYMHRYRGGVPYVGRIGNWAIGIYSGQSPFQLHEMEKAANPIITASHITDVRAGFVADPFMVRRTEDWLMFFEILDMDSARGVIGYAHSEDGREWRYGGVALAEPFHLSYPQVFIYNGIMYMVPETSAAEEVRIYTSEGDPATWELAGVLVTEAFADPTLIEYAGRWWLFGSTDRNSSLRLMYSDNLFGPYIDHPCNPLISGDLTSSRPAGRPLRVGNRLYRIAQCDQPTYGRKVVAAEILELTTSTYRERLLDGALLEATGTSWNALGVHHLDAHQVSGQQWIACADGWSRIRVVWGRQW